MKYEKKGFRERAEMTAGSKLDFKWYVAGLTLAITLLCAGSLQAGLPATYPWLENYDLRNSVAERINPPAGFTRVTEPNGSFSHWLRNLPLKPGRPDVMLWNGRPKSRQDVHVAVVDMDLVGEDLQQCADAILRLRAEHLYSKMQFADISFRITHGEPLSWCGWVNGIRLQVDGSQVSWSHSAGRNSSQQNFLRYQEELFTYAGTLSLSRELRPTSIGEIRIGNVFIRGGSPGHAVLVLDMVTNETGQKKMLLGQSYMPAQDFHLLKNPLNEDSPWYDVPCGGALRTPEWTFSWDDLKRFPSRDEISRFWMTAPLEFAQETLDMLGYQAGPVDGLTGPKTRAAWRAFLRERGYAGVGMQDESAIPLLAEAREEIEHACRPVPVDSKVFMRKLFDAVRDRVLTKYRDVYKALCRRWGIDMSEEAESEFAAAYFLHKFVELEDHGILNKSYTWLRDSQGGWPRTADWVRKIFRLPDGSETSLPLSALYRCNWKHFAGRPKEFQKESAVDRTPAIFLSDLFSPGPRFLVHGEKYWTVGWCSDVEMAYQVLLRYLGLDGRVVYPGGIHVRSEVEVGGRKFLVDSSFDRFGEMQWDYGERAYTNDAHREVSGFYNARSREDIRFPVSAAAQEAIRNEVEAFFRE